MTSFTNDFAASGANEPISEAVSSNIDQQRDAIADGSDGDGGERPVREKLKKTSIASLAQYTNARSHPAQVSQSEELPTASESKGEPYEIATDSGNAIRGRPARKRSFDDLQQDDAHNSVEQGLQGSLAEKNGHHKRMRSRDISSGKELLANGETSAEVLESHDQEESDVDARRSPGGAGVLVEPPARTATPPSSETILTDDTIMSPKKKRSRDQFDKDHRSKDVDSEDSGDSIARSSSEPTENETQLARTTSRTATGEPKGKRVRDAEVADGASEQTQKVKPTSGFANTASASPFAAFASSKSLSGSTIAGSASIGQTAEDLNEQTTTSTSAFASSGLSAFSRKEKSPFAAIGNTTASTSGGFGSLGASSSGTGGFGSSGGFGGASPFAVKAASGFGGLGGSGFGSTLGSGGFGSPKPLSGGFGSGSLGFATAPSASGTTFGGGSSAKAFGAPANDGEGDSEDDDDSNSDDETTSEKPKDRRFQEQDIETGEEAEETVFSCRAKLYHFEGKEWKERGVGTFKINTTWASSSNDSESSDRKSRLIMRTDGVHRVVLNTPIFKGMKVGTPEGGEPSGKTLNVTGMEGGKPALFILKIGKDEVVKDLYHKIMDLQNEL